MEPSRAANRPSCATRRARIVLRSPARYARSGGLLFRPGEKRKASVSIIDLEEGKVQEHTFS